MADSPNRGQSVESTGTGTERRAEDRRVDLRGSKLLAGLASLIGAWVAASPFVLEETAAEGLGAAGWNNVAVGAAIFLVAGANFYRLSKGRNVSRGAAGLVALLGLWLVLAPLAVFEMQDALLWSTVASGAIAGLIGAYNAYKGSQAESAGVAPRSA